MAQTCIQAAQVKAVEDTIIKNNANNDPKDEDKESDNLTPVERNHNKRISMYQRILEFSPGAATTLWEDQGIKTLEHL